MKNEIGAMLKSCLYEVLFLHCISDVFAHPWYIIFIDNFLLGGSDLFSPGS